MKGAYLRFNAVKTPCYINFGLKVMKVETADKEG